MSQAILNTKSNLHLSRKAWHIATGCIGLTTYFLANFDSKDVGIGLCIFALLAFLFEFIRLKNSSLNTKVLSFMGIFPIITFMSIYLLYYNLLRIKKL